MRVAASASTRSEFRTEQPHNDATGVAAGKDHPLGPLELVIRIGSKGMREEAAADIPIQPDRTSASDAPKQWNNTPRWQHLPQRGKRKCRQNGQLLRVI
jgi:hypothetical protein